MKQIVSALYLENRYNFILYTWHVYLTNTKWCVLMFVQLPRSKFNVKNWFQDPTLLWKLCRLYLEIRFNFILDMYINQQQTCRGCVIMFVQLPRSKLKDKILVSVSVSPLSVIVDGSICSEPHVLWYRSFALYILRTVKISKF